MKHQSELNKLVQLCLPLDIDVVTQPPLCTTLGQGLGPLPPGVGHLDAECVVIVIVVIVVVIILNQII